ncbi:hypothetical protein ACIBHX_49040 [Nonomuraea sp. NPDC050536]|uniref:hypothetical protein n=1 Tax=Nonomuraea sp. NPDC050536 TaxID=3364366 RepID=UPI0037CAA344
MLQPSEFIQNLVTGAGSLTADGRLLGAYGDGAVSYVDHLSPPNSPRLCGHRGSRPGSPTM